MTLNLTALAVLCLSLLCAGAPSAAGAARPPASAPSPETILPKAWLDAAADPGGPWQRLPVADVIVDGEWARRMKITRAYIEKMDLNKILNQLNHAQGGKTYLGLGKLIDATARVAASDPAFRPVRDRLITSVLERQSPEGYIGGWKAGPMLATSGQWEVHELSYIVLGLCTDHRLFNEDRTLDALKRAGDYLMAHLQPLPKHCAQGTVGLDLAVLALYERTNDRRYRDFLVERIAPGRWMPRDRAPFGHFYEYMEVTLGQVDFYNCDKDASLLLHAWRLTEHLDAATLITGASSHHEHVNATHDSGMMIETCSTTYLIRTMERIFQRTGDLRCLEIIERSLTNALFAAQARDGSRILYFTRHEGATGSGGPYVCCPMNYLRAISELPEHVAYTRGNTIAFAQYIPAQLEIALKDTKVKARIDTAYPFDGEVKIRLSLAKEAKFAIQLRIPAWCAEPRLEVEQNKPLADVRPGTFATVDRTWRDGDVITLRLPMPLRWVGGRAKQEDRAALMRGPVVWRLDPARSKIQGIAPDQFTPDLDPAAAITSDKDTPVLRLRDSKNSADLAFVPYYDWAGRQVWFSIASHKPEPWGR